MAPEEEAATPKSFKRLPKVNYLCITVVFKRRYRSHKCLEIDHFCAEVALLDMTEEETDMAMLQIQHNIAVLSVLPTHRTLHIPKCVLPFALC